MPIAHLESLRTELAALKVSVAQYRLLLLEAEERKATVQAALDAVIVPILTSLPPEITAEIFLHYAVAVHGDRHDPRSSSKDNLNLTMICRGLRQLALSIPRLWATLSVYTPWNAPLREMTAVADAWFSRAGVLPLRLEWTGKQRKSSEINVVLQRHAPRLQDLSLSVTLCRFCDLDSTLSFPLLQSLDLTDFARAPSPAPTLTFRATPRLRYLSLRAISPSSLIGIRWERLESWITAPLHPQECLDVLRKASSLLKYEFSGAYHDSYDPNQNAILLPRLTTLILFGVSPVMRYLTLPGLRNLSLQLHRLDDEDLIPFLSRSGGELRSFKVRFRGHDSDVGLSLAWFYHMMHLINLTLWELQVDPASGRNLVLALNPDHGTAFCRRWRRSP
ncbi:hypothetical protein C8R46DRAFT_1350690 [Mycena filopes]|nr:hypothetical protein C8R46DRAFT_1350690 [Mycena filopes]